MLKYFYFLLILISFFSAAAQKADIKFETVNLPLDIHNEGVNCFFQSEDGFMWIGSKDGLVRFDGYSARKIYGREKGALDFSFGNVIGIIQPEPNILWVLNPFGVFIFNCKTGSVKKFKLLVSEKKKFRTLYKTKSGKVAIGTNSGLFLYEYTSKKLDFYQHRKGFDQSLSNNIIRCVFEDKDGVLWIGTFDKLNRMDPKTGVFKTISLKSKSTKNLLQNNLILSLSEVEQNNENTLLVGTETGLVLLNKKTLKFKVFSQGEKSNELTNSVVKSILVVSPREIWLGTDRGLNLFNSVEVKFDKYLSNYNNSHTISNNIITTITRDKGGSLWLGTNNGVDKTFVDIGNVSHNRLNSQSAYFDRTVEVNAIDQDSKGDYWFATSEGFCCFHSDTQAYEWFEIPNKLSLKISDLLVGKSGHIWLSTPQGLHVFNPKKNKFRSFYSNKNKPDHLQTNYLKCLFEDAYDNIWIGTYLGGIYKASLQSNEDVHFTKIDGVLDNGEKFDSFFIKEIHGGKGDLIWVTNEGRLSEINVVTGKIKQLFSQNAYVSAVRLEDDKFLWMILNSKVVKYNLHTLKMETVGEVPKGMRNMEVSKNDLWLSTSKNLFRMGKETGQLEYLFNRRSQMRNYSRTSFKSEDDNMIFGGKNGFVAFNPNKIIRDSTDNIVQFTDLKVLNSSVIPGGKDGKKSILLKDINYVDKLNLGYAQNTFLIEFSTLNFYNPNSDKFSYILEGYDSEWQEVTGSQHFASFTRVKPGNYVFKVKAANASGVFLDAYRSIEINVNPPFWASNWAMSIYAVLVFLFLYASRKLLISRVNDINNLKFEKIQRAKTDELVSSKSRFFTNISHELKTPLTLILSPTERLLKTETDQKRIATLEIIKRNTERLIKLVNQVLDLRKIETGSEKLNLEPYDIVRFARKTISLFEEEARYRKIKLSLVPHMEMLEMNFDMTKVEKILFNLISNAFKFTPDGGEIEIIVRTVVENKIDFVCMDVSDNGIGISQPNQKLVFERFTNISSTNYTSQEGTGIGLSLVSDYTDLHQGHVKLKSEENIGSIFSVYLPLGLKKEESMYNSLDDKDIPINQSSSHDLSSEEVVEVPRKLKLLVVEDDRDMRSFISSSFEEDFDIILASDGQEGYEKVFKTHPDLIISDVMMPKMDGIALCKKLKSDIRTSHIPLILLTAKGGIESKMEGIGMGADDYIEKPFHLDYLLLRTKMLVLKRENNHKVFLEDSFEASHKVTSNPVDEKFMKDLIDVIEREMDNSELSVTVLADFLRIDKTSLYRKVKSITGQTAIGFVRNMRLKKAAELLKDKDLNVSEVMYRIGFTHRSYFTRSFKELFGVVPSDYK